VDRLASFLSARAGLRRRGEAATGDCRPGPLPSERGEAADLDEDEIVQLLQFADDGEGSAGYVQARVPAGGMKQRPLEGLEPADAARRKSRSRPIRCGGPDDRAIDALPFNPDHDLRMDAAWVTPALLAVRLALLALLGAATLWTARRGDPVGMAAVFGLACVASLVVSPISRGHYFVLLLPAVLWVPLTRRAVDTGRSVVLLTWTPAVLVLAHYALLDYSGRAGLLGIGTALWFVAATAAVTASGPGFATAPD